MVLKKTTRKPICVIVMLLSCTQSTSVTADPTHDFMGAGPRNSASQIKCVSPLEQLALLNLKMQAGLLKLFGVKIKKQNNTTNLLILKPHSTTSSTTPEDTYQKKTTTEQVTFKDVVGLENTLTEVKEVVDFLKNPKKFKDLGAHMPRGILLEGPPGTGKTLIAKAIANEAECNFLYESGSSFVEMYVGIGSKRVRELFEKARKSKPTIIFIDEFDAIGAVSRGAGANEEYRQTLNELLCQLDGFKSDDSIIVIAATNFAKALDSAVTRAGRFDKILKITLPNLKSRKEILTHYKNKLPSTDVSDKCLDNIALKTQGLNCADLSIIANEAALAAVRDQENKITDKHFETGMEKVLKQRKS